MPKLSIAFLPRMDGWGSWEWVGAQMARALGRRYLVKTLSGWESTRDCDVSFVVKHLPSPEWIRNVIGRSAVVYAPVDYFESAEHICAASEFLRSCDRILVHAHRLTELFSDISTTECVDLHLNFVTPMRRRFVRNGFILWTDVRSNLDPLVQFVNANQLEDELVVLSNFDASAPLPKPSQLGFRSDRRVRLERWSRKRQLELTASCRAAIDVKGSDFRGRHKGPATAIDFLASGVPVAVDPTSCPGEHLAALGFRVASPLDFGRWLSRDYWNECREFGRGLRKRLTLPKVAQTYSRIFEDVATCKRSPRSSALLTNACVKISKASDAIITADHQSARDLAISGRFKDAATLLDALIDSTTGSCQKAVVCSDGAAVAAAGSDRGYAEQLLKRSLELDPACEAARFNAAQLEGMLTNTTRDSPKTIASTPPWGVKAEKPPVKVAILSFLFNWPSTGGGNIHTYELCEFLNRAGFSVRHFHARFDPWELGRIASAPTFDSRPLDFVEADWRAPIIQKRFRHVVTEFNPDYVLITDSWNFKPLLAEAVREFPTILRFQAQELICPLNNLRLLLETGGQVRQCPLNQLAAPQKCVECVRSRGNRSGALHQAERGLSEFGHPNYHDRLLKVLNDSYAVLVLNPEIEALLLPYASNVRIVPWGMDPARFSRPDSFSTPTTGRKLRIFQAGLVDEFIKGFHVLHSACERLWRRRQDFELIATGNPPGQVNPWTRFTGWVSQEELPGHYRDADIIAVPTVAQDGLSRTSVEAMAVGRPVVASRIGGLPATVEDGVTGLLFEPGNVMDLSAKLETLLDDPDLRCRYGDNGRRKFEKDFTWPVVIERHYRPLLSRAKRST